MSFPNILSFFVYVLFCFITHNIKQQKNEKKKECEVEGRREEGGGQGEDDEEGYKEYLT